MGLNSILGFLAALSFILVFWQWLAARRFPLHLRTPLQSKTTTGITLLKPLKGCEPETESCLRSWLEQVYPGPVQVLFGVASDADPVCPVVARLQSACPDRDIQLVICDDLAGANAKVAKLARLQVLAKYELIVVSDADVRVPPDLLTDLEVLLRDPGVGLANCFYELANPGTLAMRWEAVAINADFWSQVLQSRTLKPLDFALGAVMATRRKQLEEIGGFRALADCLADDYQLGNRIARRGYSIELSGVVVECWSAPMRWKAVWDHQLRWARTIRVCQPLPYFFSILSNGTLWPLVWLGAKPSLISLIAAATFIGFRLITALDLQRRLIQKRVGISATLLAPLKDVLQVALWFCAFAGNTIRWRGVTMRLRRDGRLERLR